MVVALAFGFWFAGGLGKADAIPRSSLSQDIYPVQVDVNVEDTASTTEYRLESTSRISWLTLTSWSICMGHPFGT